MKIFESFVRDVLLMLWPFFFSNPITIVPLNILAIPRLFVHEKTFFLSVQTGLVEKKLNRPELALDCFFKLQAILKNHPQVLYQIASMYPFPLTSKSDCNTL